MLGMDAVAAPHAPSSKVLAMATNLLTMNYSFEPTFGRKGLFCPHERQSI